MLTFKVLSALLVYPEREVIDSLEEMAAIVDREALLPAAARADLRAFMETLKATDLMETQSNYISLFDQSRSLSLHLFEHIHGRSEVRRVGKECVIRVDCVGRRFIKKNNYN